MADVSLRKVRKSFGGVEIIKGVDLLIANGEFCVFVGPSGCIKSTLLRIDPASRTSRRATCGSADAT